MAATAGYGTRGAAEGMYGGHINYGSRSGSYTTGRGGTVNYGAAGVAGRGPGGGVAGRGVYGVSGTTAGGRSFADVGRAGGAVGPRGNAVGGRSNIGAVSGAAWYGGRRAFGVRAPRAGGRTASTPTAAITRAGSTATGTATTPRPGAGAKPYWGGWGWGLGWVRGSAWAGRRPGLGTLVLGLWLVALRHGLHAVQQRLLRRRIRRWPCPYDYSQPIDTVSAPAAESVGRSGDGSLRRRPRSRSTTATTPTPFRRPTRPWRSCRTTRPCTSFARSASSRWGATTRPRRRSTPCSRSAPAGTGRRSSAFIPNVDVYTTQLRALEEYCKSPDRSRPVPGSCSPTTT